MQVNPLDSIPPISLLQAWQPIYEDFLDGMQDKEGLRKSKLMGKINNLEFTYELIQTGVKYMEKAYAKGIFDGEMIQILSKHIRITGFEHPEDPVLFKRDLQVILNRANSIKLQITNLEAELKGMKIYEQAEQKTTFKQFDQLIAQVSIYAKFHIDKKQVTVSEFIEYYASRRQSLDALEEQSKNVNSK